MRDPALYVTTRDHATYPSFFDISVETAVVSPDDDGRAVPGPGAAGGGVLGSGDHHSELAAEVGDEGPCHPLV